MKIYKKGHTTIIKDTESNINSFLEKITSQYKSYLDTNLILDLTHDNTLDITEIKKILPLSKTHKKNKKSFIIVVQNINYTNVPEALSVVPTLLEAKDIIELEEIERELGFND